MVALIKRMFELDDQHIRMFCRPEPSTDLQVVEQVIGNHEYGFSQWKQGQVLHKLYHQESRSRPAFFCDAGANIGAFTVYMKRWFSNYCFLAIEPDEDNCKMFERNNAQDTNVHLFKGGLAQKEGKLFLMKRKDWSHRLSRTHGEVEVKTMSPEQVLQFAKDKDAFPYIFKLDIEGGEASAFAGDCDWIGEFPLIVMELHDWMMPFKGTSRNVFKAMAKHNMEVTQRGENLFFFNTELLKRYI